MRLWVEVFNANGQRLGPGPIAVKSASITRALDGAGTITLEAFGTDSRAATWLTNERRVQVWADRLGQSAPIGEGIINEVGWRDQGTVTLSPKGPDLLDELKRRTVKYNRAYHHLPLNTVVADLLSLVTDAVGNPLWTVECVNTTPMTTRFDACSVLKAIQYLLEMQGLHIRQKLGQTRVLEVGTFGTNPEGSSSELRLIRPPKIHQELYRNPNVALIERITMTSSTRAIANSITVLGAGANADTALTLAKCNRTGGLYPILSGTFNGRLLYYLQNQTSIDAYGLIERDIQIKEIGPVGTSESDEINAANALYDAACVWLSRNSTQETTYQVTVKKCSRVIQPGDKVRIVYTGSLRTQEGEFVYREINDLFWVLKVTEKVGNTTALDLEVSTVDRYTANAAKIVVGALEQIRLQGVAVQPGQSHYLVGPEQVLIDPTTTGKVQLPLTNRVYAIDTILMRVRTQRFTATAKGAAAGGDHRHKLFEWEQTAHLYTTIQRYLTRVWRNNVWNQGAVELYGATDDDVYTYESSGDHTHPMIYGLNRDTLRPGSMTITVNGQTLATDIGTTTADFDQTFDISDLIRNKAGGFQTTHDIEVSCAEGQGEVLITFDVVELNLPFQWR